MEGVIHTDITHQWALTENCLPSENYQPIYSTSKIPQPVKDPTKKWIRWWRNICRSRYLLLQVEVSSISTSISWGKNTVVSLMCSGPFLFSMEHVLSCLWIHCLKSTFQQYDWWMCSWVCLVGQRLMVGGQPHGFPPSNKPSTSEDIAAEHHRPPTAILLNPPRAHTSFMASFSPVCCPNTLLFIKKQPYPVQ